MNPLQALLRSRKFLVMLLDTTVSLVLYFSAKYLAAGAVEDIKRAIVALQPVVAEPVAATVATASAFEAAPDSELGAWSDER